MALTKSCNKDVNDSEVSWTTGGGRGRCRGLCRPSFSKLPCQQTGSPWSCSGKGLYCSVPVRDSKALRSLRMVGLQTTAPGSRLQHWGLFYYLSNEWNFHSFQGDPKKCVHAGHLTSRKQNPVLSPWWVFFFGRWREGFEKEQERRD